MAKKKPVEDPLWGAISAVIDKLKDQGALLVIGLYLCATVASVIKAASPELAFSISTFLSVYYLGFKAYNQRYEERIKTRELDNFREIELEKLRTKAKKQNLPKVLPPPKGPAKALPPPKDPK